MVERADVVLVGGQVATNNAIHECDVAITDGLISAIGRPADVLAARVIDCRGLTLLPGVIDSHVHFREPGLTEREDLESGSRAAVLGGVTTVFEMPNTLPATTSKEQLAEKLALARGRMHCDYAFYIGATHENIPELPDLESMPGCAGIKVLMGTSSGPLLVEDDESIRAILNGARRRVAFHAEDEYRLRERAGLRIDGDVHSHAVWRDEATALLATRRLLVLAHETGKRVHVVHVTTASEIELLRSHKDIATIEVTPHHLTFAAPECYERLGTLVQINPPIREARHRDALWRGIVDGTVDVVGSDHTPQLLSEKMRAYPQSTPGMPGVQTLVPLLLNQVSEGRLSLARFIELTSAAPARIFDIAGKGRIAVGYDADLTIVDLKHRQVISDAWIASRVGWTAYAGMTVMGWPVGAFVRGQQVMWENELIERGRGNPVRFGGAEAQNARLASTG
ncbi:dihydroorotase [Microbacteriaceae bacterium K1510]|nr:dihydroorotase [Microbacteriaceae bacterium K1510]